MRHLVALWFVTLTGAVVAGCGELHGPAPPISPTPAGATASQSVSPAYAVVEWECFVTSAFIGAPCGLSTSPAHAASVRVAALPPLQPLNLISVVVGATVTLQWAAPSSGDAASSYVVEVGSSSGFSDMAVFDAGSTTQTLVVQNVPAGTYYVRVRARNSGGLSGPSNEIVVVVGGACMSAPNSPRNLQANVSGTTVTLSWSAPSGGCPVASYIVEAGSSSFTSNLASVSTGDTTFATVVRAGRYYVRVRAVSAALVRSAPSNETVVTAGIGVTCTPGPTIGTYPNVCGVWVATIPVGPSAGRTATFALNHNYECCAVFPGYYVDSAGRTGGLANPFATSVLISFGFGLDGTSVVTDGAIFEGQPAAFSNGVITAISGIVRMGWIGPNGNNFTGPPFPMTLIRQ